MASGRLCGCLRVSEEEHSGQAARASGWDKQSELGKVGRSLDGSVGPVQTDSQRLG